VNGRHTYPTSSILCFQTKPSSKARTWNLWITKLQICTTLNGSNALSMTGIVTAEVAPHRNLEGLVYGLFDVELIFT
jgi:hypothetical protein